MHIPSCNAEHNPPALRQFIRDNPLGILTTAIRSPAHPFIQSSHIPWLVDVDDDDDDDSGVRLGKLRGHIARANPQTKAIVECLTSAAENSAVPGSTTTQLEEEVMVLFNGPIHHYVTPKFYTETKPDSGKVVPTWNYSAVQVYGVARIFFDAGSQEVADFLSQQIADLTSHMETSIMRYGEPGAPPPWEVADAPSRYVGILKKNIVGIEIEIKTMAGRLKWSQEKPRGDRDGVIRGFENLGSAAGSQIAAVVKEHAAIYDSKKLVPSS